MKSISKFNLFLLSIGLLAIVAVITSGSAFSADVVADAKETEETYPLDVCIVSGEKLGSMGDAVKFDHEGREIQFCCNACIDMFKAEPAKYLKKMDQAIIEKQSADYPLSVCVVSGEKLDEKEKGQPLDYVHNNRLVRFCCETCQTDFQKDPDKYLAKIEKGDEAAKSKGKGFVCPSTCAKKCSKKKAD